MSREAEVLYSGRGRRPASLGPQTHKRCATCMAIKPAHEFQKRSAKSHLLQSRCRDCNLRTSGEWYRNNRARAFANTATWRSANRQRVREIARSRYWRDPLVSRAYGRRRYANAAENRRASRRAYYLRNRDAERASYKVWAAANADKKRKNSVAYEARKLRAMPAWADSKAIEAIYSAAIRRSVETGVKYHVDHIVPLKSKMVCGLHVHHNLQLLIARENQSKSNRHWPGMP